MATHRRKILNTDASNPAPTPEKLEDVMVEENLTEEDPFGAGSEPEWPEPEPKPPLERMPQPEQPDDASKQLALAMVERRLADRRRVEEKARTEDLARNQYYIRCRVCNGHGLYATVKPTGQPVQSHQWFTTYKGLASQWFHNFILCQECYQVGRETELPVTISKGHMNETTFRMTGRHALRFIGTAPKSDDIQVEVKV